MADTDILLNGIDGASGDYFNSSANSERPRRWLAANRRHRLSRRAPQPGPAGRRAVLGLPFDRDSEALSEAGWCIVFHQQEDGG